MAERPPGRAARASRRRNGYRYGEACSRARRGGLPAVPEADPVVGEAFSEQTALDERVTLFSDPSDPQLLSNVFDGQGLPAHRQVWIENGVLKKLTYSRFWAQKKNQQPDAGTNAVKLNGGSNAERHDLESWATIDRGGVGLGARESPGAPTTAMPW